MNETAPDTTAAPTNGAAPPPEAPAAALVDDPQKTATPARAVNLPPALGIFLERMVDTDQHPALKTAAAALFSLRDRHLRIDQKLAEIHGDGRLSDQAKAEGRALYVEAESGKPYSITQRAIVELVDALAETSARWQKAAAAGGSDQRMVAAEGEIRSLIRAMAPSERLAFINDAIRSGDMLVTRAALLAPAPVLTGLRPGEIEALRKTAADLLDVEALRLSDTLRRALFLLRNAASSYAAETRALGAKPPRWAISPSTGWDTLPDFTTEEEN